MALHSVRFGWCSAIIVVYALWPEPYVHGHRCRHGGGAAGRARRSAPACALRPVALTELSRVAVACRARGVLSVDVTRSLVHTTESESRLGYYGTALPIFGNDFARYTPCDTFFLC